MTNRIQFASAGAVRKNPPPRPQCLRCGAPVLRKVMATAKYCSGDCRQKCAKEAYEKRQKDRRLRDSA